MKQKKTDRIVNYFCILLNEINFESATSKSKKVSAKLKTIAFLLDLALDLFEKI
jgi:hypothetical protein